MSHSIKTESASLWQYPVHKQTPSARWNPNANSWQSSFRNSLELGEAAPASEFKHGSAARGTIGFRPRWHHGKTHTRNVSFMLPINRQLILIPWLPSPSLTISSLWLCKCHFWE